MSSDESATGSDVIGGVPRSEAPSVRAKALREEILGSALTLEEVSYVLSLDRTTVAKYLRENTIVGFQIGREWLIPEDELRAYVKRLAGQRYAEVRSSAAIESSPRCQRGFVDRVWRELFSGGKRRKTPGLSDRFDRFTERAREALTLAYAEAIRLNHGFIGTEHLLLGLAAQTESVAGKLLASLNLDLDQLRERVESIVGRGEAPVSGQVGFTARAKKVIELACEEANQLHHDYLGTEHLLLGLLREGEGVAADVLESLGATRERVRADVIRVLTSSPSDSRDSPSTKPTPTVPPEALTLVGPDEPSSSCPTCGARSPSYFRFCFNCGKQLI